MSSEHTIVRISTLILNALAKVLILKLEKEYGRKESSIKFCGLMMSLIEHIKLELFIRQPVKDVQQLCKVQA